MTVLKGFKSLCFLTPDILLVSRNRSLFKYHLASDKLEKLYDMPAGVKARLKGMNGILRRILRAGIRSAIAYGEHIFIVYNKCVWRIKLDNPVCCYKIFTFPNGNGPLNFGIVEQGSGIKPGIYFGEYFSNPDMKKVDIYHINPITDEISVIYTFPQGEINHIHNVVPDTTNNCVWVLSGDFDNGAAIWKMKSDFSEGVAVVRGSQLYRSCIAFPYKEGLLYATDTPFQHNEIRVLEKTSEGVYQTKFVAGINGPCIYGAIYMGHYVFTSATEPLTGPIVTIKDLLSRKKSPGVKNNHSEIYIVNDSLKIKSLSTNKKDWMPYYLCQFGNISIPNGQQNSHYFVTYNMANQTNNFSSEIRQPAEVLV